MTGTTLRPWDEIPNVSYQRLRRLGELQTCAECSTPSLHPTHPTCSDPAPTWGELANPKDTP
jgi:hypothetical protein